MVIAQAAGFLISTDELKKTESEISDEELEHLAGGIPQSNLCSVSCHQQIGVFSSCFVCKGSQG